MYAKQFMKKYGHGGEVEKKMSYYKEGGEVSTDKKKKTKVGHKSHTSYTLGGRTGEQIILPQEGDVAFQKGDKRWNEELQSFLVYGGEQDGWRKPSISDARDILSDMEGSGVLVERFEAQGAGLGKGSTYKYSQDNEARGRGFNTTDVKKRAEAAILAGDVEGLSQFIDPGNVDVFKEIIPNMSVSMPTEDKKVEVLRVGRGSRGGQDKKVQRADGDKFGTENVMRQGTNEEDAEAAAMREAIRRAQEAGNSGR